MNLSYKALLAFLVFLLPVFSFAQSNYKPGYIVTLNGDTVKGLVNYKERENNPKTISFKKDEDAKREEYSKKTMSAFGIIGYENFTLYKVWVSRDRTDLSQVTPGIDTAKITDTVFLRQICTGKNLTLLSYTDKIKQRFYVKENGNNPIELQYHEYMDATYQSGYVIAATYKIQLQKLAIVYKQGDHQLIDAIQTASYKDYDLSKVVNLFNDNNIGGTTITATHFFVGVGANSSRTNFTGNSELSNAGNSSSVFPEINVGADIYANKNIGRWILRAEVTVSPYKADFTYNYTSGAVTDYKQVYKNNQIIASLTPQVIYNFYNADNFKFYLSVGLGFHKHFQTTTTYTETTTYTVSGITSTANQPLPLFRSATVDVPLSIGFVLHKNINIYAGYIPKSTQNNDIGLSVNETSYRAGVNYLFGR